MRVRSTAAIIQWMWINLMLELYNRDASYTFPHFQITEHHPKTFYERWWPFNRIFMNSYAKCESTSDCTIEYEQAKKDHHIVMASHEIFSKLLFLIKTKKNRRSETLSLASNLLLIALIAFCRRVLPAGLSGSFRIIWFIWFRRKERKFHDCLEHCCFLLLYFLIWNSQIYSPNASNHCWNQQLYPLFRSITFSKFPVRAESIGFVFK